MVEKLVVDHKVVEVPTEVILDMNYQPMPPQEVMRKPEEQRSWKWWTLIIRSKNQLLKPDDVLTIGNLTFRIQSAGRDWTTSGFSIWEAIEDFTPPPVVST